MACSPSISLRKQVQGRTKTAMLSARDASLLLPGTHGLSQAACRDVAQALCTWTILCALALLCASIGIRVIGPRARAPRTQVYTQQQPQIIAPN
jgi:hypothetical protein